MDALALLCNLHADGPATLQRLRRVGCDSIEGVAQVGDLELGHELRQGEAAAQRFKREAQNLLVRLEGGAHVYAPEPEPELEPQIQPTGDAASEPAMPAAMSHVLEAWRQMDEESPPAAPARAVPEETPSSEACGPEMAEVEGLTPALLMRLGELGIRSLPELIESASLELSQCLPLALTRVRRLQLLARKHLQQGQPEEREVLPLPARVLRPQMPEPGHASVQPDTESAPLSPRPAAPAAPREQVPPPSTSLAPESAPQELRDEPSAPQARHPLEGPQDEDLESDGLGCAGPFA